MISATSKLEEIGIVEDSNLTQEEKDLLMKAVLREIPWTQELKDLFLKGARGQETN